MLRSEVVSLWEKALKILEKQLNKNSFDTWLKPLKPLGCHDNTIIIEVPNNFSRGWLSDRYAPLLKNVLHNVTGQDIGLQFLLANEASEMKDDPSKKTAGKPAENPHSSPLNPKYTFDTFIIGNSNRFTHAASFAVAESPAKAYNPLFIYGGVGLGKTHLMHAIGQFIMEHNSKLKVFYVTSEKFTNELINSIRDDKTVEFRNKYRGMDILLVDDIQFLAGKERTQEEFFHIFNALYDAHKQIVITSDVLPKEIATLEERLTSRFEWGLIADISRPDYETKVAILKKKAELDKIDVPPEVLEYIAANIGSNIRELEGALMRVLATASLTNEEVTLPFTEETLKDIIPVINKPITIDAIMQSVSSYFHISVADLQAKRRSQDIAMPRQIAMYLSRDLTEASLPYIGEKFGGRDHTTVIYACQKIQQELKNDDTLRALLDSLVKQLKRGV